MATDAHFLTGSHRQSGAPKLSPHAFCIHCFHSLGVVRNSAQREKTEAKHICPEKLLSWQPCAPPPYN